LCASRAQAEQVKARLAGWLEPRGLALNEAKTRIVVRHEAARSEWIRRWEGRRMSVT
jgi:RNA-directed DNA polymerase